MTLRNRIATSPMTMHESVDGIMDDYHVMCLAPGRSSRRTARGAGRRAR